MERERLRGREKFKRLGYKNRFKKTTSICKEESNISRKLRIIGYCTNGKEAHHWNYNLPYSIFLLSRKAHKFRFWLDINNINEELVHININSSITQKNLFNRND